MAAPAAKATSQPIGALAEIWTFWAGAVPALVTMIGIELCGAARAQRPVPPGDLELELPDDIERELSPTRPWRRP